MKFGLEQNQNKKWDLDRDQLFTLVSRCQSTSVKLVKDAPHIVQGVLQTETVHTVYTVYYTGPVFRARCPE